MKSRYQFFGQSMLEVLVALGSAVIIITSITVAVITSLNNTKFGEKQNAATQYAQEGLDIARTLRDRDYLSFADLGTEYCLGDDDTLKNIDEESCEGRPNLGGDFIRTLQFNHDNNSCDAQNQNLTLTEVTSRVSWTDGKCGASEPYCHNVTLVTCFSDVRM